MARICPSCGTTSMMGTTLCPKCGNSLLPVIDNEISALNEMKVYAIIVLVFAVLGTTSYALDIINTGNYANSGFLTFLGIANLGASSSITTLFVILEIVVVASIFFQIISFVYLRTCFSKLLRQDYMFSTPKTGVTILIIGLSLAMVGIAVILALLLPLVLTSQGGNLANNPDLIVIVGLSALLAFIGGLLAFIGYIMGALLGIHRLATKFEESMFDWGWILLIISLFFSPLALVSGILFLQGTSVTKRRLMQVKSNGEAQQQP